jgi:RNA polymerase sigma factor (sigma-70 family)
MASPRIDDAIVERLYRRAGAEEWSLPRHAFVEALERSVAKAFGERPWSAAEVERYLESLHLHDLALASACALGHDGAWGQFVREQRPILYRAADALDPSGNARELADGVYGDLFGVDESRPERGSLFRYFHGRSSLATWLRAVLAQRHIDRVRASRRLEPLPGEPFEEALADSRRRDAGSSAEHHVRRAGYLSMLQRALRRAIAHLAPRDRLRLACYYAQEMTLAEVGRLVREHEATVSRHLARTRKALRADIEEHLRAGGLTEQQMHECFESVLEDTGPMDLNEMLEAAGDRKELARNRSEQ